MSRNYDYVIIENLRQSVSRVFGVHEDNSLLVKYDNTAHYQISITMYFTYFYKKPSSITNLNMK